MPGRRPPHDIRLPVSRQSWRDLTFLHWRVDATAVAQLLPDGLAPDLWDGDAWLSLTPFMMRGVRAPAVPPVPKLSDFPETNLRTYVRGAGGRDGLWFLSLDVTRSSAVLALRGALGLPYTWSEMSVDRAGNTVRYRCRRRGGGREVTSRIDVRVGAPLSESERTELDDWLSGRWGAYTRAYGKLLYVPVVHQPWPLSHAEVLVLDDELVSAAGFPGLRTPDIVRFSPGVDVDIGAPRPVDVQRSAD